jgi:hypothetical protein
VKAPDVPGAPFTVLVTTPFAAPEHAASVARVLLALDAAVR